MTSTIRSGKSIISSGVGKLDDLLDGLFIGDNVVWYDDAGSLAHVFFLNFIKASQKKRKPIIYVSFDRSPRNLLEILGTLADDPLLTILDCFTFGKGTGSPVFLKFYEKKELDWPCKIVRVEEPRKLEKVMDAFYSVHDALEGDVRFIFESLTGMQNLWGGEDYILEFYSHSCPRLYELNTIAYWIMEKRAHSARLRAKINQIAQVVIDLSIKRGTSSLTILKAERRHLDHLNKSYTYWRRDLDVTFDTEQRPAKWIDLGFQLKNLRSKKGFSQTELAKLVGVTPSTISQIESNLIYPSLPALLKMAEVLSVEVNSFFRAPNDLKSRIIFTAEEAVDINFSELPKGSIRAKLLTPMEVDLKVEPYIIEIPPKKDLPSHFFVHKGEEYGYVLSGKLQLKVEKAVYVVKAGDLIYLTSEMPSQWRNPGPSVARILWTKIS